MLNDYYFKVKDNKMKTNPIKKTLIRPIKSTLQSIAIKSSAKKKMNKAELKDSKTTKADNKSSIQKIPTDEIE